MHFIGLTAEYCTPQNMCPTCLQKDSQVAVLNECLDRATVYSEGMHCSLCKKFCGGDTRYPFRKLCRTCLALAIADAEHIKELSAEFAKKYSYSPGMVLEFGLWVLNGIEIDWEKNNEDMVPDSSD